MNVRSMLAGILVLSVAIPAMGQVSVVGGKGAGLQTIAGSDTLVTVILKKGNAKDPNLKIVSVEAGILTVQTQTGQNTNYLLSDIAEVRVQGEVIAVRAVDLLSDRGMTKEQQEIVIKALEKATELYNTSVADQTLHMFAAEVLLVGGAVDEKSEDARGGLVLSKPQAQEYLNSLVNGNDLRTALNAALHLTNASAPIPAPDLVQRGIMSGDRLVKASAARLAGLTGDTSVNGELRVMLQDRAANVCVPAAIALSLLGERDILPTLLSLVGDKNTEKANAAVFGLEKLGDATTIAQLKAKLPDAEGRARFRIARVLHNLGDEQGGAVLRNELMDVPSLQFESALVLAAKGDVKAMQFLRDWLGQQRDPSETVMLQRAEATAALVKAGDRTNAGVFQELLRDSPQQVQLHVLHLLTELDVQFLLPMILPTLTGQDPAAAITACQTAVAMAHNEYRQKLRVLSQ